MSGTLLRVEPVQFVAASRVIGETVAERVLTAAWQLTDDLAACGGMAGSDPCGAAWGAGYDEAARSMLDAGADVVAACFRLAALLQQTGLNYGRAESASGGVLVEDRNDYADRSAYLPPAPSAVGGSGPAPAGWALVEHVVGWLWPNGHQDRLRRAAVAWAAFASGVAAAADDVPAAVAAVAGQQVPEVDRALAACRMLGEQLSGLAATARGLGPACDDYAGHLDDAHAQVEHELAGLLEWTAAIEAAGAVGALFTFGVSEAAAQAVESSRIAAAAARIAEIIEKLAALARGAAEYVANLGYDAARIARQLTPLLTSRVVVAMVEDARGVGVVAGATRSRLAVEGMGGASVGLSDDAVEAAYQGLRSGGGHAVRHLRDADLVPNAGSLAEQINAFRNLTQSVLRDPAKTFVWMLGATRTDAYAGTVAGRRVVVFVAAEGPYRGRVLSAVVPDAEQISQWGLP